MLLWFISNWCLTIVLYLSGEGSLAENSIKVCFVNISQTTCQHSHDKKQLHLSKKYGMPYSINSAYTVVSYISNFPFRFWVLNNSFKANNEEKTKYFVTPWPRKVQIIHIATMHLNSDLQLPCHLSLCLLKTERALEWKWPLILG